MSDQILHRDAQSRRDLCERVILILCPELEDLIRLPRPRRVEAYLPPLFQLLIRVDSIDPDELGE
jgi:hypothetical protein